MWSDFREVTEAIERSPRRGKVDGYAEKDQFFWMGSFQIVGVPSFLASSPAIAAGGKAWHPVLSTVTSSNEGLRGKLNQLVLTHHLESSFYLE